MKISRAIPMVLGLFLAGTLAYSGSLGARVPISAADETLKGPDNWVAFEADFVDTGDNGAVLMTGKIYRASDGSYRRHGTNKDGKYTATIHNIPRSLMYDLAPGQMQWTSQPLGVSPGNHKAPVGFQGGRLVQSAARHEGYRLYESPSRAVSMAGRLKMFVAPELNFQALVLEDEQGSFRETVRNIRLVEPSPDLFTPPTDALVTFINKPGGIVLNDKK